MNFTETNQKKCFSCGEAFTWGYFGMAKARDLNKYNEPIYFCGPTCLGAYEKKKGGVKCLEL